MVMTLHSKVTFVDSVLDIVDHVVFFYSVTLVFMIFYSGHNSTLIIGELHKGYKP